VSLAHHLVSPLVSLGAAALLTVAVEVPTAGMLGFRRLHELAIVALANLATNPIANLAVALAMAVTRARTLLDPVVLTTFVLAEIGAVVAEWGVYRYALPDQRHRALRVSIVANAISLAAGILVFGLG
jgi:hypothetical protein